PRPPRAKRRRRDPSLLGGVLPPGLRSHGDVLRGADPDADSRVGRGPSAQRRAGGRVRERRPRLQHRRRADRPAARPRLQGLGGQGGDEVFGGYARYLIAYFEQCIKAAIDGTMHSGNFIVTYESIIPNLQALREYKPLLQEFWREGLFEDLDRRYFRLINRAG